jgi:hypothetical protein
MSLQYSQAVLNAKLDAIETTISTAPLIKFYTGAPPATCATAPSGTLLGSTALPSDYLSNAAAGVKSKTGSWTGTFSAAGTVGYFRITYSAGTTAHVQGTVTATGGGGDMTMDNNVAANLQAWTVNTFAITSANA